jgi:hypothetical protein
VSKDVYKAFVMACFITFLNPSISRRGVVKKMSEAVVQPQTANTAVQPVQYILYDPARRRRRARRARRYDPAIVAYEPARRRRRSAGVAMGNGQVALVDSVIDGAAWGFISKRIPIPSQNLGPLTSTDAIAVAGAFVYEKFYMRRKWLHAFLSAAVAYMVGRWTA